ncbi:MAG: SusC/RagA family TonB-linked outer membrane protein [Chitinophagaceae bacterium]|nr:SusC/RagA family TonB-linked outer membrane protein [Chitinophagaceae bacterium]
MKLTAVFLIAVYLHVSAAGYGQKVSISGKDLPLEKVFNMIEKQTGYKFFYDYSIFRGAKNVSLNLKEADIDVVIKECLRDQPLEYNIVNKTIYVTKKAENEKAGQTAALISTQIDLIGKVVSEKGDPIQGAAVFVKGTGKGTNTDDNGSFVLKSVPDDAALTVSSIGYYDTTVSINGRKSLYIRVRVKIAELGQAVISASNGYQQIPMERATGSYGIVNNELYNRKVSTNILDRIDGVVTGIYGTGAPTGALTFDPKGRSLQITVRGISTLSTLVGTTPLIVLDNVPYEGDINNLNPNDIETVSILKDAAAASLWGARAGNGVIVLTTKKGAFNKRMKVEFNSNITIVKKPNIFNDPEIIDGNTFINIEDSLFNQGFFDADISNTTTYAPLSPVVNALALQRAGVLSAQDANNQINALRNNDVRRDFLKYVYQNGINQQYSIGVRGGSDNMNYYLSVGHDNNRNNLVRNGYKRTTINGITSYAPIKNLEITTSINYSLSETAINNQQVYPGTSISSKYLNIYPYAQLADAHGNALSIVKDYSIQYKDSMQKLGFLDWQYKPLDEIKNADNKSKTKGLMLKIEAKYKITSSLNIAFQYANETQNIINRNYQNLQTYAVRSLINRFAYYDPSTNKISYAIPLGGILTTNNYDWNANNWRLQASFNRNFSKEHSISAIAGGEIRQLVTTGYQLLSYGYDDKFGVSSNNLDYSTAQPVNPVGTSFIPAPSGNIDGITNRYISYYSNIAYTFKDRYTLSLSGRKDGSNIFGVKTNDRVTPLWSVGSAWDISKEDFYRLAWLPRLKIRGTYGYNGNVYNGTAYVTGTYGTSSETGAQLIRNITPPNPNLHWERVRNIDLGIDFSLKDGIINGTMDLYQKDGLDLVEPITLAASTGFTSFTGNAASTKTRGIELSLNSKIINKEFKWSITFLANYLKDKVEKYDVPQTAQTIQTNGGLVALKGKPLYSLFSYRWAGLDPQTGDPQGYLNKQVSKDYQNIISNFKPDSLVYSGSTIPTFWGTLRNDFYFKGFSLSVMIAYRMGYYFRRPSITGNLQDMIGPLQNVDYLKRWQKPGDEKLTDVPSVIYPANPNRAAFYQYSAKLVEKGDHVRLQDIRLSYDLGASSKKLPFSTLQVYTYLTNLGIIWRANKYGIDPDSYSYAGSHSYPNPFSIAFGFRATF